jgi:hypothetical protein
MPFVSQKCVLFSWFDRACTGQRKELLERNAELGQGTIRSGKCTGICGLGTKQNGSFGRAFHDRSKFEPLPVGMYNLASFILLVQLES